MDRSRRCRVPLLAAFGSAELLQSIRSSTAAIAVGVTAWLGISLTLAIQPDWQAQWESERPVLKAIAIARNVPGICGLGIYGIPWSHTGGYTYLHPNGAVLFTVIQPPTGSEVPVSPDRPRLILLVLLAGLAAGVGVTYFMNELRPVFCSGRQLAEITNVPVLAIVGMTWIERHMAQQRRALWAYSAATAALVLVAVITLLIQSPTSHFIHRLLA